MANEWNVSYPLDHTKIGDVPGAIRTLKDSAKDQIDREHETPVDGDATGGEHSNGSAVAYVGAATPTNRPDGATALSDTDIDDGRLWLDDTASPATLKRWKDSAFAAVKTLGGWTPAAYNDEESITFPNGLILKQGTIAYNASATVTVTFGTAFPNAANSAQISVLHSAAGLVWPVISSLSVTALAIKTSSGTATTIHWMAWGR